MWSFPGSSNVPCWTVGQKDLQSHWTAPPPDQARKDHCHTLEVGTEVDGSKVIGSVGFFLHPKEHPKKLTNWMSRWKWMDQRLGSVGYNPNIQYPMGNEVGEISPLIRSPLIHPLPTGHPSTNSYTVVKADGTKPLPRGYDKPIYGSGDRHRSFPGGMQMDLEPI